VSPGVYGLGVASRRLPSGQLWTNLRGQLRQQMRKSTSRDLQLLRSILERRPSA
jgi:hypothetical protein